MCRNQDIIPVSASLFLRYLLFSNLLRLWDTLYLCGRFPQLREVDDVVQEAYARLLREKTADRVRHVRAFLFTAARNIALD
ncbi:MAG: hypothetical protein J6386_04285 [Candidatus Synoicihabitans palmerolidicus]|nr:hypothetical protein [Candidatus Synoicihabitans palmerolidicus]